MDVTEIGVKVMENKEVEFGEHRLKGTLIHPDPTANEKFPAILLIAGSGPIDRDGNNINHGMLNIYNKLAESLSEKNYITLRYDKRGVGKSEGDFVNIGLWDLVNDAKEAFQFLISHPDVDKEKVFVLGHSEGAIIASEIAKDEDVAGLMLLGGAGESLREAMTYQRKQVVDALKATKGIKGLFIKLLRVVKRVEKQEKLFDLRIERTDVDSFYMKGQHINAKWFREHYAHDVKETLKQITCPILAITGEKDVQSNPEKVEEIRKYTEAEVEAHIIPKMNHMLRDQEKDYSFLQIRKAYIDVGEKPLSEELLEKLRSWLERQI